MTIHGLYQNCLVISYSWWLNWLAKGKGRVNCLTLALVSSHSPDGTQMWFLFQSLLFNKLKEIKKEKTSETNYFVFCMLFLQLLVGGLWGKELKHSVAHGDSMAAGGIL